MRTRPRPALPSKKELSALIVPIAKRMPAYIRLGWLLAKEPTIPWIHRSGLYATVVYIVTPAHIVISTIPVLGQIDLVLMLLLSLRQALKHCPPETLTRLCTRAKLKPDQIQKDIDTVVQLTSRGTRAISYSVSEKVPGVASMGRSVTFAGRVANGFTRRVVTRLKHSA